MGLLSNKHSGVSVGFLDGRFVNVIGDTMTGLLQFSGTTHAGLKLNNLTTTQRDAIVSPSAGMLVWNTTTTRANVYTGSAWTAGWVRLEGDTMTGTLNINSGASNPLALLTTGSTFQTWTRGTEVLTLQQTIISAQFMHFLSTDRILFTGTNGETVFGDVLTNATTKQGRFSALAYNSDTQPAVTMLFSNNTSTANSLNIGGGTNINQAATAIRFHTTPSIETLTGTLAGTIDGSGYWNLGSQATGLAKLHIDVAAGSSGAILRATGGAPTSVTADITGFGLMAGNTVNATNKYTSALKFGSTDTSFTTTNPKYGALIVGYATENYTTDTDSGMGLEFFTTPNDAGAIPIPVSRGTINQDGTLTWLYSAVFNENGNDIDFRVEGDTRPNLLMVDASDDAVMIDGGMEHHIEVKNTNYTLTTKDYLVVFTANATATLPSATGSGRHFAIGVEAGSGATVVIDGNGTDTIDGDLTQTLTDKDAIQIIDYASGKWIII